MTIACHPKWFNLCTGIVTVTVNLCYFYATFSIYHTFVYSPTVIFVLSKINTTFNNHNQVKFVYACLPEFYLINTCLGVGLKP